MDGGTGHGAGAQVSAKWDAALDSLGTITPWGHTISMGALTTSILGWAPAAGASVAFIWYMLQIYESRTFQSFKNNFIQRHRAKKLAKLIANEKVVLAAIAALELLRSAKVEAADIVQIAKSDAATLIVHTAASVAKNDETHRMEAAAIAAAAATAAATAVATAENKS